jgi:sugar/nucleoside kinase (ribokinase family)
MIMTPFETGDTGSYDVLLKGTPSCDLTFAFNHRDTLPSIGQEIFADGFAANPGGIFNIASALSRLSLRVGLVAVLGNDMFSHLIAERMKVAGLSLALTTWVDCPVPVISAGISLPHDRLFVSYRPPVTELSKQAGITVDDLDRYRPRAILTYGDLEPEVLQVARDRGMLIYADTYWDPDHLHDPAMCDLAAAVNVFSPNLPEALEITGANDAESALEILSRWGRCIVIKCGPAGCLAIRDGTRYEIAAPRVAAIDTTGAGDNFNAGLMYGLLHGFPFEQCLRCAVIAGALSTLALGGSGSGITECDLEEWLTRETNHAGIGAEQ